MELIIYRAIRNCPGVVDVKSGTKCVAPRLVIFIPSYCVGRQPQRCCWVYAVKLNVEGWIGFHLEESIKSTKRNLVCNPRLWSVSVGCVGLPKKP